MASNPPRPPGNPEVTKLVIALLFLLGIVGYVGLMVYALIDGWTWASSDGQPFTAGDTDLITTLIATINAYIAVRLNLPEEQAFTVSERTWWRVLGRRIADGFVRAARWFGIGSADRFYDIVGDALLLVWVVTGVASLYVWRIRDAEIDVVKNAGLFFLGAVVATVSAKLTGK